MIAGLLPHGHQLITMEGGKLYIIMLKDFLHPLMLSCDEEGILTQDINPNPAAF